MMLLPTNVIANTNTTTDIENAFVVPDIKTEDLSTLTEVVGEATIIHSRLTGRAESTAHQELEWFLTRLHESALSLKVSCVVIDFRALEFMTSSCFKAFVVWICDLADSPRESQYRIQFISDPKKHWQDRSLVALACFADDLVEVKQTASE